jgi:hypothetical protein
MRSTSTVGITALGICFKTATNPSCAGKIHISSKKTSQSIKLRLIEELKPLQEHILTLLEIPRDIYALAADAAIF